MTAVVSGLAAGGLAWWGFYMVFVALLTFAQGAENEDLLVGLMPAWIALGCLPAAAVSAMGLGAGFRSCGLAAAGALGWVVTGVLAWPLTGGMAPWSLAAFGVMQALVALAVGLVLRGRARGARGA